MSSTTKTVSDINENLEKIYGTDFNKFTLDYDSDKKRWVCAVQRHANPVIEHLAPKLGELSGHLYDLARGKA